MEQSPASPGVPPATPPVRRTVAFLFTDIEGSTQRWERFPSAMGDALRRHDAILHETIAAHGGHVFKTIGDAFCAVFATAEAAIAAACDIQRSVIAADWRDVDDLRIRMAVDSGVVDERDDDYFGPTLNRVARMLAAGNGGQVLVSSVAAALARGALPENAKLLDLGEHRFRDLSEPERAFQLAAPGLPDAFPSLRSVDARPNNLPLQRSSLIGRDAVVALIGEHLAEERLVTLFGTGGVGKTRVALAVAADISSRFPDGVWLVEFAGLGVPSLVPSTVAAVLGIRETPGRPIVEGVIENVKSRRLLLVFDNCEHVVAAAADLAQALLRSTADVRILATSREVLRVPGERVFRMPSLSVPPPGEPLDLARALQYESIALFRERACAADSRFRLTDETVTTVADICRSLDGIALAIELAAARTKILSPRQLKERLNERLRILTGGDRTALPRQQTMRALIDWSYDLLSEDERRFFRRTSIFAGDWTFEAAESVCDGGNVDTLDMLTSLVEKSLVDAEVGGERYRLLESMRAYGYEKLGLSGELPALAERHARWFADCVDHWYASYWRESTQSWLGPVMTELDNVRAALIWALGDGHDPTLAARIAGGLEGVWYNGAHAAEGRQWLADAFARLPDDAPRGVVAVAWLTLARLSSAKGMVDAARRAVELFQGGGQTFGAAGAHHMLAIGLRRMGSLDEAENAIDRALDLYAEAKRMADWPYVMALDVRAGILRYQGRIAEARLLRSEAMTRFASIGDEHGSATVRLNLADLEAVDGNVLEAIALSQEAARLFHDAGETANEAIAVINIAAFRLLVDDLQEAHRTACRGLRLAVRSGFRQGVAIAIQHVAAAIASRDPSRSARLLGYVDAWYESESFAREPTEQKCYVRVVDALAARLSETERSSYVEAGTKLSEDEAVLEALETCEP